MAPGRGVPAGLSPHTRQRLRDNSRSPTPSPSRMLLPEQHPDSKPSASFARIQFWRGTGVLLLNQQSLHPAVDLMGICALKPNFLAGLHEPTNHSQTQLLCFVRPDVQSPACLARWDHLVLESTSPFRLILHWKRVRSHFVVILC
jgi:hypothetical protein